MSARSFVASLCITCACACAGPIARAPSRPLPPPTDASSCARLCGKLDACGGAPARCEADCERDRSRLRAGFSASFVACVEDRLPVAECASLERDARQHVVAVCYSATLDAYGERDGGASLDRVLLAMCRRRARCDATGGFDERACVTELDARERARGGDKLLAVAREELVVAIASCVEQRPCTDGDPVGACASASFDEPPSASAPTPTPTKERP